MPWLTLILFPVHITAISKLFNQQDEKKTLLLPLLPPPKAPLNTWFKLPLLLRALNGWNILTLPP
jgi:hypothetical protein